MDDTISGGEEEVHSGETWRLSLMGSLKAASELPPFGPMDVFMPEACARGGPQIP